jgi:hypothetical protein
MFGNLQSSDIIALSAAVIALCSLIISIWQGYLMRMHNRISLRPKIDINYRTHNGDLLGITLQNNGFGTAIVSKTEIRFNDQVFLFHSIDEWYSFMEHVLPHRVQCRYTGFTPDKDYSIAAGDSVELFVIEPDEAAGDYIEQKFIIDKLKFNITYRSLYNEKFIAS